MVTGAREFGDRGEKGGAPLPLGDASAGAPLVLRFRRGSSRWCMRPRRGTFNSCGQTDEFAEPRRRAIKMIAGRFGPFDSNRNSNRAAAGFVDSRKDVVRRRACGGV